MIIASKIQIKTLINQSESKRNSYRLLPRYNQVVDTVIEKQHLFFLLSGTD